MKYPFVFIATSFISQKKSVPNTNYLKSHPSTEPRISLAIFQILVCNSALSAVLVISYSLLRPSVLLLKFRQFQEVLKAFDADGFTSNQHLTTL